VRGGHFELLRWSGLKLAVGEIGHLLAEGILVFNPRQSFFSPSYPCDVGVYCCWLKVTYVESVQTQAILVISHVKQSFSQTLS
jgi:hypothetical protein